MENKVKIIRKIVSVTFFLVVSGMRLVATPLSFSAVLKLVQLNNPAMKVSAYGVATAKQNEKIIKAKSFLSTFQLDLKGGLLPDEEDLSFSKYGVFGKSELKIVQPLFTFGKGSAGKKLASSMVGIAVAKSQIEKQKLFYLVAKSYWSFIAAAEMAGLAAKFSKDFSKLKDEVKKELDKPKSSIDDLDFLEVKASGYAVINADLKSRHNLRLARIYLAQLVGLKTIDKVVSSDVPAPPLEKDLKKFIDYALKNRAEIIGLRGAVLATKYDIDLKVASKYPDIYIAGGGTFNLASNRPSDDGYNSKGVGLFLGMKWKLDFWRKKNILQKSKIKNKKTATQLKLLKQKITVEVQAAFLDIIRLHKAIDEVEYSFRSSKTWFRLAGDNWELGIGKVSSLIKAYKNYYKVKGVLLEKQYRYNMAVAKLSFVLGNVKILERWLKNGKVKI